MKLGLTAVDAEYLRDRLLAAAKSLEATPGEEDRYGKRYLIDVPVVRAGAQAIVRSAWIVRRGEDFPRLITCFVL